MSKFQDFQGPLQRFRDFIIPGLSRFSRTCANPVVKILTKKTLEGEWNGNLHTSPGIMLYTILV